MAMENSQLINNFPTNTSIYRGCSTATFDYRRLTQTSKKGWSFFHLLGNSSESGTCRDFFWSDHLKPQICWTYTGSHGISHNLTCNSCPIFGEHHFYVLEKSFFHPFGVHGLLIIWGAFQENLSLELCHPMMLQWVKQMTKSKVPCASRCHFWYWFVLHFC